LKRSLEVRAFLDRSGWPDAWRAFLLGDASTRTYETVARAGQVAILMNAPRRPDGPPVRDGKPYSAISHLAEDIEPFVAVAAALSEKGFHAPHIHAFDLDAGFIMLEHLGTDEIRDAAGRPIPDRYRASVGCLAAMHGCQWPRDLPVGTGRHHVPDLDLGVFHIETELLTDWYAPRVRGGPLPDSAIETFRRLWKALFDIVDAGEKTLILRDFHSPNIIWMPRKSGHLRIGLIDFQDALFGSMAYDVASVVQDARVDIPSDLQTDLLDQYCSLRAGQEPHFEEERFRREFAILAAQRATKILGIFVRLDERDGKPGYLRHIPRLQLYLRQSLRHPVLADLAAWYEEYGILDADIAQRPA
jgi:aminoglycoside/choline kinase family phosphotransferase